MKRHITKRDLSRVKELNLLSYFMNYAPDELIKNGRTDYTTRTHSSLHLSNGLWYWWKIGRGGRSALDYLIYVEEYSFLDAALHLRDLIDNKTPTMYKQTHRENIRFKKPYEDKDNFIVIDYLVNKRRIDKEIVYELISNKYIYQDAYDYSVVFIGYDEFGFAKYAMKRSTTSNAKKDVFVKMKIKELSENISRMTYAYINPNTNEPTIVPAKHYKDILDQPVEVMIDDQVKRQFLNIMFKQMKALKDEEPLLFYETLLLMDINKTPDSLSLNEEAAMKMTALDLMNAEKTEKKKFHLLDQNYLSSYEETRDDSNLMANIFAKNEPSNIYKIELNNDRKIKKNDLER